MERFNNLYTDFLKYLLKNFPSYKKYINTNNKNFLSDFIELNLPYMEDISIRNVDIFLYKYVDAQLIRGLKFKRIIDKITNKNQYILESIWRQLHTLYIVAYNSCDLTKIVRKHYSHHDDLSRIVENHNIIIENIMISGHPIIESSENSSEEEEEEEEEPDEEEQKLRSEFEKIQKNKKHHGKKNKEPINPDKDSNAALRSADGDEEDNEEEDKTSSMPNLGNLGSIFENSLIGDLAKELSLELDPKDLDLGINVENPQNIGEVMSSIASSLFKTGPNGENKIQNIAKTVSQKLDNKIKSGEVSKEQLANEIQNIMGGALGNMGGGDLFGMMQQMGNAMSTSGSQAGFSGDMMSNMMSSMMGGGGNNNRKKKRKIKKTRKRY